MSTEYHYVSTESELYQTLRSHYINQDPFLIYEDHTDPLPRFNQWLQTLGCELELLSRDDREHVSVDAVGVAVGWDRLRVRGSPDLTLLLLKPEPLQYQPV